MGTLGDTRGRFFLVVAGDGRVFERVGIARPLLVDLAKKLVASLKTGELEKIILG